MYKSKLAIFFDSVIYSIICLLLTYSWINKILKNAFLSIFIANIISIILFFVVFLHFLKQYNFNKTSNKELILFEETLKKLRYSSTDYHSNYFCKLLKLNNLNNNFYENNDFYFYINITTPLSTNEFYLINNFFHSKNNSKKLIIISLNTNEDFIELLKNSPIKYPLFLKQDLFQIIKINNCFIHTDTQKNNKVLVKIKSFFISLTKVKFKTLFSSGLSLIVLSFFIPYSLLYLIIGSMLLIFSLINILSKNKKISYPKEISINDIIKK